MAQLLSLQNVCKSYYVGEEEHEVLRDVNLNIAAGEMVAVLGPSGSGKTTLMNIMGCLDEPSRGRYTLDGMLISELGANDLARIRNRKIGFVFQNFQLLPRLTAFGNVETPLIYSGLGRTERRQRVEHALHQVGLSHKAGSYPNQLSGGQQQRVAIARAVVTTPAIILADEPTGALDQKTGQQLMELLQTLNRVGRTIIMITHDKDVAKHCRRTINILDGCVTEQGGGISA